MTDSGRDLPRATGRRRRAARHERGWSLSQLAVLTGGLFSKSRISNYEQGLRRMSIEVAQVLADALGIVSAAHLLCPDEHQGNGSDAVQCGGPTEDELRLLWKFRRLDEDWRRRVLAVVECMLDCGSVGE